MNCSPDVFIDKETNSLFIADLANGWVLRWFRRQRTAQGEVIVENVQCVRLAIYHQRYLCVSDDVKAEVR